MVLNWRKICVDYLTGFKQMNVVHGPLKAPTLFYCLHFSQSIELNNSVQSIINYQLVKSSFWFQNKRNSVGTKKHAKMLISLAWRTSTNFSLSESLAGGVSKIEEEGHPFSPKYLRSRSPPKFRLSIYHQETKLDEEATEIN